MIKPFNRAKLIGMRQKGERSLLFDVLLSFVFNLYGRLGMELFRDQRDCALVGLRVVLCAYVYRLADDILGKRMELFIIRIN